jgi:hypothetical protein
MELSEALTYLGGAIAFLNLYFFAFRIVWKYVPPTSPSSWVMWTVLDAVLTGATLKAGKPMYLPLGFTLGAFAVTVSLFIRGRWQWSWRDSLCAVCAAVAAWVWVTQVGVYGVVAGVAAMYLASIPLVVDLFRKPVPEMRTMFAVTAVGSLCTLLGSDWTLAGALFPTTSITFNAAMALLVSRRVA